jgi:hypothetical protein
MKEKTKEYMSGLFDAEGCFTINSCFRKKSNCLGFTAQIKVASTNLPTIKWICENFGGTYKAAKKYDGCKQAYYWTISNSKHGLSFISHIQPFLINKKDESLLMNEYYSFSGKEAPEERIVLRDNIKKLKWDKSSVTTDMPNIPDVSNAYCAGYIDGDGSITKTGIQVEGKDYRPIKALHNKYGGNFYHRELSKKNEKWNDTFIWTINNQEKVELILLDILPYLIEKRDKALFLLNSIRSKRNKDTV